MKRKKMSYASEFARKGAKARAEKLTKQERVEIARKGAKARWAKERKKSKQKS